MIPWFRSGLGPEEQNLIWESNDAKAMLTTTVRFQLLRWRSAFAVSLGLSQAPDELSQLMLL